MGPNIHDMFQFSILDTVIHTISNSNESKDHYRSLVNVSNTWNMRGEDYRLHLNLEFPQPPSFWGTAAEGKRIPWKNVKPWNGNEIKRSLETRNFRITWVVHFFQNFPSPTLPQRFASLYLSQRQIWDPCDSTRTLSAGLEKESKEQDSVRPSAFQLRSSKVTWAPRMKSW